MKLCTIKGFTSTYLICFTLVNSVLYSTFVAQNKSTQVQYCIYKTETVYPEYVLSTASTYPPFFPPGKRLPRGSGGVMGFHGCPPSFFQPTFFQL